MTRFPICISIALLFLFAAPVYAQSINAGFPSGAVWLSKTNVTAGDAVELFTAVYNGGEEKLTGTVVFTVDEKRVGSQSVELTSGASQLVSVEWKAEKGEHKIAANIEGASSAVTQARAAAITVNIAEPPPVPLVDTVISTAADIAKEASKSAVPAITSVANDAYGLIESIRLDAVSKLEDVAAPQKGGVLGAATSTNSSGFNSSRETPSGMSQIKQVAAGAALIALKSKVFFYPLFLLAIFGLLYILFRWAFKRP